jgi:hypothetical protein
MKALAAEVTANFGKRLAPLGLVVRELTGAAVVVQLIQLLFLLSLFEFLLLLLLVML